MCCARARYPHTAFRFAPSRITCTNPNGAIFIAMQLPFFKKCTKCYQSKLITEFGNDNRHTDGKQSWCKECMRHYVTPNPHPLLSDDERKENHRIQALEYYYRNSGDVQKRNSKWKKEHPDAAKAIDFKAKFRRRARKEKVGGIFTKVEFQSLCEGYGNICLCCRQQKPLCADHVIPLSRGGSNSIENIQPLCRSCNCKKHSKTIDYR